MNFIYGKYLPFIIIGWVVLSIYIMYRERKFFKFVHTYWFLKRRWRHYLGSFLWLLGILGLLLSLMDWRGPEEKIKAQVSEDKTIILIDTSASMLAEDVKPSRLQKGIMLAKHFIRRAPGQQMSIVAFAEIQTKIVPFTNDLDLLDARLDSLKNLKNHYGSSALSIALQESILYFQESGDTSGNIIVITDGEETAEGVDVKIPKDIRVALVGVGTTNGGRIPLDDSRGFRFGYKKTRGKEITTKLNPSYFKTLEKRIPVSKTWILGSYNLPSDEIASFFQNEKKKSQQQQDMVIRPVKMEWIVLPSLGLFILGLMLKSMTPYRLSSLIVFFLLSTSVFAQEPETPEKKELDPQTVEKLSRLERGDLSSLEKLKLADDLMKQDEAEQAIALYQETISSDPEVPTESIFNYGTALLKKGDIPQGLTVYEKMKSHLSPEEKSKYLEKMSQNTMTAIQKKKEQDKKEKQEKKDNKDQKENENKDQSGSSGDQEKKDQKKNKEKEDKKGQGKKDEKKDKKETPENQDEKKDEKEEDKQDKPDQKPMPPKKVSPLLKQLMNDDRQLQMKMIENGTRDLNKRHSRDNKDW